MLIDYRTLTSYTGFVRVRPYIKSLSLGMTSLSFPCTPPSGNRWVRLCGGMRGGNILFSLVIAQTSIFPKGGTESTLQILRQRGREGTTRNQRTKDPTQTKTQKGKTRAQHQPWVVDTGKQLAKKTCSAVKNQSKLCFGLDPLLSVSQLHSAHDVCSLCRREMKNGSFELYGTAQGYIAEKSPAQLL